jgi:hypothetical protein
LLLVFSRNTILAIATQQRYKYTRGLGRLPAGRGEVAIEAIEIRCYFIVRLRIQRSLQIYIETIYKVYNNILRVSTLFL